MKNLRTNAPISVQIFGWILFILCALCYIAANIRSGDWLSLAGSVLFLAACVVFVVPQILTLHKK